MTTRSTLNYSLQAEDLQRLNTALGNPVRASTPTGPPASSTSSSSSLGTPAPAVVPSPGHLLTSVEQKFVLLKECSKDAFVLWYPSYLSYKNEGGSRSLAQLMDPPVKTALRVLLSLTPSQFFASSSDELYLRIADYYELSTITNYRVLLTNISMKVTSTFNRQSVDLYIQHFINLLDIHPTMFDLSRNGTTEKNFTLAVMDGLQPLTFQQAVRDRGPETITSALDALKAEMKNFVIYDTIRLATSKIISPSSTSYPSEGKVADVAISTNTTATRLCNNCQSKRHRTFKDCPQLCRLCPGLAPHKFYQTDVCRQYLNMKAKKIKNGTWIDYKQANIAASVPPPSAPPSDLTLFQEFKGSIDNLTNMLNKTVSNKKRLLIDSGCNTNIISSPIHSDIPIIYRDSEEGISTANGQVIPILGHGSILDTPADFVPSFVDSLLSVSHVTKLRNSCFIFSKNKAFNIVLTPSIINLLSQINSLAVAQKLILCTASLTKDNLYAVDPTINPTPPLFAASTYYQTAKFNNVSDIIKYFHETWSHASMDLMIQIIKNKVFTNLPSILTESAIRKYFPTCPSCSAGNMTRKSYTSESIIQRDLQPGEELIMDIKIIADNKNNISKRSFNNNLSALTIIDNSTNFKWGFPLQNHGTSNTIIEKLNIVLKEILSHGRILKIIRADAQFVTSDILTWCANCTPQVQLLPCIPHEHQQIGKVERFNQTWENTVIKLLANKPHLSYKYWALAYNDVIMKSNILPMLHHFNTPYQLWHDSTTPIDLDSLPMVPFGSIVMAHVPVHLQSTLHPKSIRMIAVGSSLIHQGGILLYNPTTNKIVTRRTFKQIGPIDISPIDIEYTVSYEEDGIPLDNTLDMPPTSPDSSNNLTDYQYLLHTVHTDDEDNKSRHH